MKIIIARNEGKKARELYDKTGWGRMYIDRTPNPFPGEPWAWDNGAWQAHVQGKPLDIELWKHRTRLATAAPTPYMAILPDIVAGGLKSLELSARHIDDMPLWWPKYLPVQNGIQPHHTEPMVPKLKGIFLGGDTEYKRTAHMWAEFAHAHGLRLHYARAGTRGELRHAHDCGADSLDTARPLWIPRQYNQWMRWTQELQTQGAYSRKLDKTIPPQ